MKNNIYVICIWTHNEDNEWYSIVNFLKNKHPNCKINAVTVRGKQPITPDISLFEGVVILERAFDLTSFLKNNEGFYYFFYSHKKLHALDIKLHFAILLSNQNVAYFRKSLYAIENFYEKQIAEKKYFKKLLVRTIKRNFLINTKIILVYSFFLPFFYFKKIKKKLNFDNYDNIQKILFIRIDRFGDMVLAFSSIVALRKKYPKAEISILCSKKGLNFLELQNRLYPNNLINKILLWDDVWDMHGGTILSLRHFTKLIKKVFQLRKQSYDVVIQPVPISIWVLLALLLKSKKVIATVSESLWLSRLIQRFVDVSCIIKKGIYIHYFYQNSNCLKPLRIENVKKSKLYYDSNSIKDKIKKIFYFKNIVINISSGDEARKLILEKLEHLIGNISSNFKEYKIILIGTKEDKKNSHQIHNLFSDTVIDFVGSTDINDLIYIFNHSKILITPDTGTMHLASLTDIYIIAYFGAGNLSNFKPITNNCSIIKHELGCSGCGDICFTDKIPKPCIETITADEIFEEIKKVLDKEKNR